MTLLTFDNLTLTQILREIKFWRIQTVQNVIFAILEVLNFNLVNLSNFQVHNLLKLPRMTFLDRLNLISRKIGVVVKLSNNKVKP